jgi:hypothetical protein
VTPLRPFEISVYNRVESRTVGSYLANQVPAKGDMISFFGHQRATDDPWYLAGSWVVDSVSWHVASAASVTAFAMARESGGDMAAAYCTSVEIHVWPAEGPHWSKTPRWAKAWHDDDEAGEPSFHGELP